MKSNDTQYFLNIKHIEHDSFSALRINIRCLNKNFENFKRLLSTLEFKLVCVTEMWSQEDKSSLFHLPGYSIIHQNRSGKIKGGGVCVFILNSIQNWLKHEQWRH